MDSRPLVKRSLIAILVVSVGALLPGLGAASAEAPADGTVIRNWNTLALSSVKQARSSDAQAARAYAMVNVAMYDAVNGVASPPDQRTSALVPPAQSRTGDPGAAAATAAHDVLAALFPAFTSTYDQQRDQDLAAVTAPGQAKHGQEWGADVAAPGSGRPRQRRFEPQRVAAWREWHRRVSRFVVGRAVP